MINLGIKACPEHASNFANAMNLSTLFNHLPYLSYGFRTLSSDELLKLEHSLLELQRGQHLRSVWFLGRLEGRDADYFLAFGCPDRDLFAGRKLFYSQNLHEWFLLLEPKQWDQSWDKIGEPFRGDPAFRVAVDLGPAFTLDEDQVPIEGERIRFDVKEQNRLWFVATRVLEEAALVPRGMLYQDTNGNCVVNPYFGGISEKASMILNNYQHFREPRFDPAVNLAKRDECSYFMDVFDPADDVVLKEGSFVVRQDVGRDVFVLNSMLWPGMINFHRANTGTVYGFCYFGDGSKNWELPFKL